MLPLHWIPLILNRDRSRFIDKDPLILFAVEKVIICCLFYSLFFLRLSNSLLNLQFRVWSLDLS